MTVPTCEWLEILEREYLADFITAGGAAVKFVVSDNDQLLAVQGCLREAADQHNLAFVAIDSADARLHMIQDVFFGIARALDWNCLAQRFVETLVEKNDYA